MRRNHLISTHVTAKQKGTVRIQMFDDNGKTVIATLYNVLLAPDLCDRLFSIITLMNSGHTCHFHKGFCTVYFGAKEDNAVTLAHSAVRKHAFMVKSMESSKKNAKKNLKRKKISLELMHLLAALYLPRHWQCPQPLKIWLICAPICDALIPIMGRREIGRASHYGHNGT